MSKMQKCNQCDACKRIYDKTAYRFWRREQFYCTVKEQITRLSDFCENWRPKNREFDLSADRFDKVTQDLELLKVYLKDL